jgi:hypothetical protein
MEADAATEDAILAIATSDEPFTCTECYWSGAKRDLVRFGAPGTWTELACPICEQAWFIFPSPEDSR